MSDFQGLPEEVARLRAEYLRLQRENEQLRKAISALVAPDQQESTPAGESLGESLKNWLTLENRSQSWLAEQLGMSRSMLSFILNGHQGLALKYTPKLGEVTGYGQEYWGRLSELYRVRKLREEMASGEHPFFVVEGEESAS